LPGTTAKSEQEVRAHLLYWDGRLIDNKTRFDHGGMCAITLVSLMNESLLPNARLYASQHRLEIESLEAPENTVSS
jgi:hypothetical protein